MICKCKMWHRSILNLSSKRSSCTKFRAIYWIKDNLIKQYLCILDIQSGSESPFASCILIIHVNAICGTGLKV